MFQTVCFDFDSTLASIEGIDVLAEILQVSGIQEITDQAMNGEISTREAFEKRIEALSPYQIHLKYLAEIYKSNLVPGAIELCEILRFLQKKIIIVSGGFQEAIKPIGDLLGAQETIALQLVFDYDGKGVLENSPLVELDGKPNVLNADGRLEGPSVFIGDGVTDYATVEIVDKMIPYYGISKRPFVDQCGLEAYGGENLLGLLGLIVTPEEWFQISLNFPKYVQIAADLAMNSSNWLNLSRDLDFMRARSSRVFLVPGPTEIPEDIQLKRSPIMAHRSAEFEALYSRNQDLLKNFLGWDRPFLTVNGSATAMMEALLSSIAPSNILACVSGSFGERFFKIANRQGHQVTRIDSKETKGFSVQEVISSLPGHDVVLLTHNETSNGILNQVQEIVTAIHDSNFDPLVFVDGVSSVGGIELSCQYTDGILFGTQKCFALPPGLAFCAISEKMQDIIRSCAPRSFYLDLKATLTQHEASNVPFTPAVDLFQSLEIQLNKFIERGAQHFQLYTQRAEKVWNFCEMNNLEIFADLDYRSLTVTSVKLPSKLKNLRKICADRSIFLAKGYGPYASTYFRIGHMGELTMDQMDLALNTIEECL